MAAMDELLIKLDKNLPLLVRRVLNGPRGELDQNRPATGESGRNLTPRQSMAGVLLLLKRQPEGSYPGNGGEKWVFQLIKRSARTAQGGDISCPGGMLSPALDWAFSLIFIRSGRLPLPTLRHDTESHKEYALRKKTTALFYANALRESWEELRLNPLKVTLLGILPTYSLYLFRRTIFPLVALADPDWSPSPNSEVEKIIEIPLEVFFREESYGRYMIHASAHIPAPEEGPWEFPCLIHADDGGEEILWGATFYIILNFLRLVFAFELPDLRDKRIRHKTLNSEYLTGNRAVRDQ